VDWAVGVPESANQQPTARAGISVHLPMHQPHIDIETLVALRRSLHADPELRFNEFRTAETLAKLLSPMVDELQTGVAGTGLIATVHGRSPGRRVLLRADMDAYPVTDEKTVSYASRTPGVTHACGHDVHMAVAVGVLTRLCQQRPESGSVTVVLDTGLLGREPYDAVMGLHCWPDLPAGTIGVDERVSMAAKDAFKIDVLGTSAHAATPAFGRDAVLQLSSLVCSLYELVNRRHNPAEMVAFNIGTIVGGSSQSSVANHASATGTLRTHDESIRARLRKVVDQAVEGCALQFDAKAEITWANEMPAVLNAPTLVDLAMVHLPAVAHVEFLRVPPMTTDDFALLDALGPTLYLKLGVTGQQQYLGSSLHSSTFDVDEQCIQVGVRTMETLTRAILDQPQQKTTEKRES
jgi:amidohydrolase